MYRIDVPSAVTAKPQPAAQGTPGFFSDGDPASGLAGTIVPADFLNAVMLELLGLLTEAGIAPSKSDTGQVLAAIKKIIAPDASIGANGYVRFGFGLIVQWGLAPMGAGGTNTIGGSFTFPIPFPTAVYTVVGNADNIAGNGWSPIVVTFPNTILTGSGFSADTASSSQTIASGRNIRWLALGR